LVGRAVSGCKTTLYDGGRISMRPYESVANWREIYAFSGFLGRLISPM
jgi:hypothetical protein